MSNAINAVMDGYLRAVNWIVQHPHIAVWSALGAIIVALVI